MSDELALHILRRPDIEAGTWYDQWEDQDRLARPTAEKRLMMLENPSSLGADEPMQLIGTRGRAVIGRLDLIAGQILAGRERVPILWGSSLFVPEEHRSTMMGAMLLMKANSLHDTLGAHGPSQLALPLYQRLGWTQIPLQRWIWLRRSNPLVERSIRRRSVAGIASAACNAVLRGQETYIGLRRSLGATGLTVTRADRMPSELDVLLTRPSELARGLHDSSWINWVLHHRFGGDPGRHERCLYLVKRRGRSESVGYFLLKVKFHRLATHRRIPNLTLASLADAMVLDEDRCTERHLLLLAMREARRLSVDALELCDRPHAHSGFYRSLGMIRAGRMHLMFRATPPSPLAEARWKDPTQWAIRQGDGDNIPS